MKHNSELRAFADLLLRWNRTINLVGHADEAKLWDRHIVDCLQLLPLIPPSVDRAIDMGSGAGLPGMVLALAGTIHVTLIESDHRKAAFLREAIRVTCASADVLALRIEDARPLPASLITARALAPLSRLLALAHPLLAPGGYCLFPKGRDAAMELTTAGASWHMHVERFQSSTESDGTILRLSDIRPIGQTGRA